MEINTNDQQESEPAGAATSTIDTSSAEEMNTSNEEQPINSEESEKEKHDTPSKSDSEMKDNETDPQPLFEQPIVLDGKRSRRPTARLDISDSTPSKKELSIPQVSNQIKNNKINKCLNTFVGFFVGSWKAIR